MIIAALLRAIGPLLRRFFGGGEDGEKGQNATGTPSAQATGAEAQSTVGVGGRTGRRRGTRRAARRM
jgi:hypothetical protein